MNINEVRNVSVIGAGAMGRQIALNSALSGFRTTLTDMAPAVLEQARAWIEDYLEKQVSKGKRTREQAEEGLANCIMVSGLAEAVKDADLVIEAIIEKLDAKRELFAQLDKLTPSHAILASNSSYLASSRFVDVTTRPEKVANLHYFNPAMHMQLVEVIRGDHTSEETAQILIEFVKRNGKTPIFVRKEVEGFVVNRLLKALQDEAYYLLVNGVATFEEIDLGAEKGLNFPMGPFRLMDLTGLDINYMNRERKFKETGLEKDRPPRILEEKYLKGELGRKTGKGWYEYPEHKK